MGMMSRKVMAGSSGAGVTSPNYADLVYWHTMDDISGTVLGDESPNGNDGAITGATAVSGKIGNALSFDGTDDFVTFTETSQQSASVGALSFIFRVPDTANKTLWLRTTGTLINTERFGVFVRNTGGGFRLQIDVGIEGGNLDRVEAQTTTLTSGVYYHVAISQDGTGIKISINNVDQTVSYVISGGTTTLSTLWISAAGVNLSEVYYGKFYAASVEAFNQYILDNIREFSSDITASQISELYNGGTGA